MKNIINKTIGVKWLVLITFVLLTPLTILAQPKTSELSNPLAITLLAIIVALLIVIAVLASVVLSAAKVNLQRFLQEKGRNATKVVSVIILMMLSTYTFAAATPDSTASTTGASVAGNSSIAGLSNTSFYILLSVIALEVIILLVLLNNIKLLLKQETTALEGTAEATETVTVKKSFVSWWEKFNSFRPIKEEAQLDLGHDYDGIRELDNKLPGWWLYGFYCTILFAGIYLYRYHVAHSAPLSHEELKIALEKAEVEKQEYLKKAGNNVNESNVVLLTDAADLAEGKKYFIDGTKCAQCHRTDGGGNIGPNLTDDYWLHGNTIKDVFKTITYGYPEKGMLSWKDTYSPKQIQQIASYVLSLHGSNPPNPKAPQGVLVQVAEKSAAATDSTKAKTDSTAKK